jgi:hypothetical protein
MLASVGTRASRFLVSHLLVVASATALLVVPACSSGPERPPTIKVTGKVTMNGTPVPGATVSFQPTPPGGRAAVGITDDAGRYTLTTFSGGDGAVAGDYAVTVNKTETVAATSSASANSDEYVPPEGLKEPPPAKSLIPPRFGNARESGLRATVGGGSGSFDFELGK